MGETSHLNQVGQIRWKERGRKRRKEKKKENKRKRKGGGVRSSTFSLDSTEIEPSVFVREKGKVQLRDESFAWVRESGVFTKLREVGVPLLPWLLLV